MSDPNKDPPLDTRLRISFPKSSEDHRLQLIDINGSIFAVVHSPLESQGPIHLHCEDWSLVILAPIKSKTNILISGANIVCLNEVTSEEGNIKIHASKRLVKFTRLNHPDEKAYEMGERGQYQFDDDPAAFLNYYRLFHGIVSNAYSPSPDSFSEAQQKVIMSLCGLADKMEGKTGNLTLRKVLEIWDIPHGKPS